MLRYLTRSLLIALFSFCSVAYAQVTLTGRVISEASGKPIPGASIYFNNTSIGTSSNDSGDFKFTSIPVINTEIIVTSVGYEILAFKLDAGATNGKRFICKLIVKEEQLKEVLILSDARKRRWLALFKENFLGLTQEADRSNLLNDKNIYFTRGDNSASFKAYCDTPLIIINKMLGYKISFQLIEFSFDENTGRTYFYGYTRYDEMGDKKRWTKNRQNTYYGSTLHFYRSLIRNQLEQEGYDIYLVKKMQGDTSKNAPGMAIRVAASNVVKTDSADAGYFRVTIDGRLMVQYKRTPASKNYLAKKTMINGNIPHGYRANIISKEASFLVDKNGIVADPMSVEYSDYWIYEKAANLLPFDYEP